MAGWTNRGKLKLLQRGFAGTPLPTNYYLALVTSAVAPTADTNLLSDLTEIAPGNGYTSGGFQLSLNATDFDSASENDGDDTASIQIKDVVFTAAGGPIPASGNGARYAVLTDDNGVVANREVYQFFDLESDRTVVSGQSLSITDATIRLADN